MSKKVIAEIPAIETKNLINVGSLDLEREIIKDGKVMSLVLPKETYLNISILSLVRRKTTDQIIRDIIEDWFVVNNDKLKNSK
jgi:hypothetical protein